MKVEFSPSKLQRFHPFQKGHFLAAERYIKNQTTILRAPWKQESDFINSCTLDKRSLNFLFRKKQTNCSSYSPFLLSEDEPGPTDVNRHIQNDESNTKADISQSPALSVLVLYFLTLKPLHRFFCLL